ncbi:MAG TPA: hypothetical protein V6C58_22590 [Allocoleopsis sp.]
MNKISKFFVVFMIFALTIFVSGCNSKQTTGKTFIGGTEGLRTSFLPGSPPDRTVDGGQGGFTIVVKAENVGESDVKTQDGYIQIWGLDASTYGSNLPDFKKQFTEDVRGAQKNFDGSVLNGGVSTIDFGDLKYMPTIQGDLQQKIWANVCYKYTTKVATQICVKNNVEQALSGKEICEVEGEKNPQNSGAPIHVTSLKESYAGSGKIGLTLQITHVGNGDAFFKDDKLECNNVESNLNKGKVRVKFKDVQVSGKSVPVVCQSITDGYARLLLDVSGKETTTLYCTIDVSGSDNVVEVPLELELGYVYLQHVESDITIRHISK